MPTLTEYCTELAAAAAAASRPLALSSGAARDAALAALAEGLLAAQAEILAANAADVADAEARGTAGAFLERLRLTPQRIAGMAAAVREIAAFPDPLGRVIEGGVRPNGLEVRKIRVPLGVVFFVYESRPNVTTDAAALCVKSGNAVILRGGSEARRSNAALGKVVAAALAKAGLPASAVAVVDNPDRAAVGEFLKLEQYIDVAIPRGGEDLIRRVAAEARMPVLKHFLGVCHVYVDASADAGMAERIVVNGKVQRPSVCNATECLLIHADAAARMLPALGETLRRQGVELRGCPRTMALVPGAVAARAEDFGKEFGALVLAVKVVDSLDEALAHIERYGSKHTDAIVTNDLGSAQRFVAAVDAAAVLVNASTRFNDGGEFGLGAEIGISTDKYHARGPCGLNELTSTKYVVYGTGQVRG